MPLAVRNLRLGLRYSVCSLARTYISDIVDHSLQGRKFQDDYCLSINSPATLPFNLYLETMCMTPSALLRLFSACPWSLLRALSRHVENIDDRH